MLLLGLEVVVGSVGNGTTNKDHRVQADTEAGGGRGGRGRGRGSVCRLGLGVTGLEIVSMKSRV